MRPRRTGADAARPDASRWAGAGRLEAQLALFAPQEMLPQEMLPQEILAPRRGTFAPPPGPHSLALARPPIPRSRIHFGAVVLEATLVVLGVVLALGLNEYRQHRADERRAAYALSTIKLELMTNRPVLAETLAYHERARARLRAILQAMQRDDAAALDTLPNPFPYGIQTAKLFETSWQAAREAGALQLIPYDVTLALTRLTLQSIMAGVFSNGFDERLVMRGMDPVLGDFLPAEAELLRAHDHALALLQDVPLPEGAVPPGEKTPAPEAEPLADE